MQVLPSFYLKDFVFLLLSSLIADGSLVKYFFFFLSFLFLKF